MVFGAKKFFLVPPSKIETLPLEADRFMVGAIPIGTRQSLGFRKFLPRSLNQEVPYEELLKKTFSPTDYLVVDFSSTELETLDSSQGGRNIIIKTKGGLLQKNDINNFWKIFCESGEGNLGQSVSFGVNTRTKFYQRDASQSVRNISPESFEVGDIVESYSVLKEAFS